MTTAWFVFLLGWS